MRMPWSKPKPDQLELLDADPEAAHECSARSATTRTAKRQDGRPIVVPVDRIDEDPNNPRTEFLDAELDELADDIRQRGILQPLVVHPADAQGRYQLHFGAKRLRAALRAGLIEVPVVVRDAPSDAYDQVAENQKRHALTPPDLARFIKGRVDAGESNAEIARRLGMNLTTVAHHLSLLDLPPVLNQALESGRCTSPRTLHELSKLHEKRPDQVHALVNGPADITREAVASLRVRATAAPRSVDPIAQANAACGRLEQVLASIGPSADRSALHSLRLRLTVLSNGDCRSDRQTPGAHTA